MHGHRQVFNFYFSEIPLPNHSVGCGCCGGQFQSIAGVHDQGLGCQLYFAFFDQSHSRKSL